MFDGEGKIIGISKTLF